MVCYFPWAISHLLSRLVPSFFILFLPIWTLSWYLSYHQEGAQWIILPASGLKLESFFQVQLQNQLSRLLGKPLWVRGPASCGPSCCRAPGLLLLHPTPILKKRGAPSRQGPCPPHSPLHTPRQKHISFQKDLYGQMFPGKECGRVSNTKS